MSFYGMTLKRGIMKIKASLLNSSESNIYPVGGNVEGAYFDPVRQQTQLTLARAVPIRLEQTTSAEDIIDVYEKTSLGLITEQQDVDDDRKPFREQLTTFTKSKDNITKGQIVQQLYPQEFTNIEVDSYKKTASLPAQRSNRFSKGSIIDLWA